MNVDFIDRAFLHRLAEPISPERGSISLSTPPLVAACEGPPPVPSDPVVATLLARYPTEWEQLASRVEAAWAAGERLVALAGRARGDGVSTVVRGLAHVFHERGVAVTCRDRIDADPGHDGCCVLVDGGVWFPPGPVHRGRLARAAFGCHAAVLVRRAGRAPCPAHAAALVSLGIHVLGEVVTFADGPSCPAPDEA